MIRKSKCLVSCHGYFAKTLTSLLPQLTVLGFRCNFLVQSNDICVEVPFLIVHRTCLGIVLF
jgi:hypothetical protein